MNTELVEQHVHRLLAAAKTSLRPGRPLSPAAGALSAADGRGVGIARYVRDGHDPQAAEIAVTIVDDWQGRGLGAELLSRLSDLARQAGIHRFTALVSTDNAASAGLLRNLGACLVGQGPGTVEYELALEPADYSLDWWTRCAIA